MKTFASLLWIALAMGAGCISPAHATLTAGAAKRSIVPSFPTPMGGFGDRAANFEGVHDELFVRALVLDDGTTRLAIVGSDLLAPDEQLVMRARKEIYEATGIPPANIMISAAHNHSAPYGYRNLPPGETNPLLDFMVRQFSDAVIAAYEARVPARIGYGAGELAGATRNRQQSNEEIIDTQVGVLRVEHLEGRKIIAVLFNFTGHPVILGSGNLLLSGEYPGAACRAIETLFGGVAIFTQGAAGDVTVHRSGDPFLEVQRVGRMLAGEVIKTSERIRCDEEARLAAALSTVTLPPRIIPTVQEAQRTLDRARADQQKAEANRANREVLRGHENKIRLFASNLRRARALEENPASAFQEVEASVQVIQVGDLVLIGIPGELFVQYALEMRSRVKQNTGKATILVGYCNGYMGYIVTPRAMVTGGYEASVARVDESAGRLLTEEAMAMVDRVVR